MFGWLTRRRTETERAHRTDAPTCVHAALVPRWESVDDMGHEDRASSFRCDACGSTFTPAEAQALRRSEAERVRAETAS